MSHRSLLSYSIPFSFIFWYSQHQADRTLFDLLVPVIELLIIRIILPVSKLGFRFIHAILKIIMLPPPLLGAPLGPARRFLENYRLGMLFIRCFATHFRHSLLLYPLPLSGEGQGEGQPQSARYSPQ